MTEQGFPLQTSKIDDDQHAIAPYNFVRLPEKVVPAPEIDPSQAEISAGDSRLIAQDRFYPQRHTGFFECTVTTDSPLFIRGMSDPRHGVEQQRHADFFYINSRNEPVIPGSSLRGLVRTLVEIVSFGKVNWVNNELIPYRGLADMPSLNLQYESQLAGISVAELVERKKSDKKRPISVVKAGFIEQENGFWYIREATQDDRHRTYRSAFQDSQFNNFKQVFLGVYEAWLDINGHQKLTTQALAARQHPRLERVYVMLSGSMPGKKTVAVLYDKNPTGNLLEIPDEVIQTYRKQLSAEQIKLLGPKGVLEVGHPVFYMVDDQQKISFMSHTRNMRVVYPHTMRDFVPPELRDNSIIDLPEAMFGFVREKDYAGPVQAYAGRISFHDAQLQTNATATYMPEITPKILNSPKPTTFQHYLVQTSTDPEQLKHYGSTPGTETVIRGHKHYWHQGNVTQQDITATGKAAEKENVTTRMQPLESGHTFTFTINFTNFTDIELGALYYVLSLCKNDTYRLKLGMGKSLGLGSIKLAITNMYIDDRSERYRSLFNQTDWHQPIKEPNPDHYVNSFKTYIATTLGVKSFDQHPRIKELLTMLKWRNAPLEDPWKQYTNGQAARKQPATRYMEIERPINEPHIRRPDERENRKAKLNEYRYRPILGTPDDFFPMLVAGRDYDGVIDKISFNEGLALIIIDRDYNLKAVCSFPTSMDRQIREGRKVRVRLDRTDSRKGEIRTIF